MMRRASWVLLFASLPALAGGVHCAHENADIRPSTAGAFAEAGDGVVRDLRTGIVWDRCAWGRSGADCGEGEEKLFNWKEALAVPAAANRQRYKGSSAWRLPTIVELTSLVEDRCYDPPIDEAFFPNTPSFWFWSATPYAAIPGNAWFVIFDDGADDWGDAEHRYVVRLVRDR